MATTNHNLITPTEGFDRGGGRYPRGTSDYGSPESGAKSNGFGVPDLASTGAHPRRFALQQEALSGAVIEADFVELPDGTLAELIEDPANSRRAMLAAWKDGEVRYLDRLQLEHDALVPLPRDNEILGQVRLPNGVLPYGSVKTLAARVEDLISRCISIDETFIPVLADFVFSTWLVDRLTVAPYLSIVGLPQSGKTTLLKVLALVSRRPLLIADVTPASFYRACARFMPTLLIDEAGTIANTALRHLLRAGTTRDAISLRGKSTVHPYGAKAFSWLEPPDDTALNSRCVLIPMHETTKSDLVHFANSEVQREAATIQAQLLQFRFDHYKNVQPVSVPGDEFLRPRARDLLRSLAAGHLQNAERSQRLLKFFDSGQAVPQEPLIREQNAVLRALYCMIHLRKDFDSVSTGHLTRMVNYFLESAGENLRLQPRRVGAVVTSLGFCNRRRTNSGWFLSLDRKDSEKVHQLAERYGIDDLDRRFQDVPPKDCDICRVRSSKKSKADANPEVRAVRSFDLRQELASRRS